MFGEIDVKTRRMTHLELIYCRIYERYQSRCSFPSLETLSPKLAGLATLSCLSTALNQISFGRVSTRVSVPTGTQWINKELLYQSVSLLYCATRLHRKQFRLISLDRGLARGFFRIKRHLVDLEQLPVINRICNFPSLKPFFLEFVRLATLLCGSVTRVMMNASLAIVYFCL
jgi:hypothetical protein